MIFGGFSTSHDVYPRPEGAGFVAAGSSTWKLGGHPVRVAVAEDGRRQVLVLGWCSVTGRELQRLADAPVPTDVSWKWPGAYTVVEETADMVVVHTDPAAARPVYVASYQGKWAWCTSARMLAALIGAAVDTQRLTCAVFLPSVPALVSSRTFFTGVEQLPPGSRIELPAAGGNWCRTNRWRPDPVFGRSAPGQLRDALSAAVALRLADDPALSCDLSGGLDSTTIAVLAATKLPLGRTLNAVTIHPEGNQSGADLHYARLAAEAHAGHLTHHLLALGKEHLPYTSITAVPATDEPAPSTLAQARLIRQLRWMHAQLGTCTHLTGDGGDSVLFQPPLHLADLIRHHRWRRSLSETVGWARLRHSAVRPLLGEAIKAATSDRPQALAHLARDVGSPNRHDHGHVRWFPLLPFPIWAEPSARDHLTRAAHQAAAAPDPVPGLDASVRTLVDEVREIARTAAADAALAAECGIDLHNPFLDPLVVDAVLRTPLDQRAPVHAYKPILSSAMADLLPPPVAARSTKGSFDADHYTGMRANLSSLLDLADGHLAALGLIDPGRLRRCLREAAAGVPMPLATIEQALTAEAWLVAHLRDPTPGWTDGTARNAHG